MKKKIIIIPILVLVIIDLVCYLTPKTFAKDINHRKALAFEGLPQFVRFIVLAVIAFCGAAALKFVLGYFFGV